MEIDFDRDDIMQKVYKYYDEHLVTKWETEEIKNMFMNIENDTEQNQKKL